jgi:hypothetical protein
VGGKKTKQTDTYTPPSWVESNAQLANQIGSRIGTKEWEGYSGERVAGLSENEQMGMQLARDNVGIAQPYYDKAEGALESGMQSWADADQSKFINPYIKGALDPAAREIREQGARDINALEGRSASMNAFGGSRAALAQSEARKNTLQGVEDLYGKGYAAAYEFGAQIFGDERTRDLEAAGRFQLLGGAVQDSSQTDISTLMTTGATDRGIQQSIADFDFAQFMEERDWDWKQLAGVVSALQGTHGSYGTTSTSETEQSGGEGMQALGMIAQVVAAMYTGGASTVITEGPIGG